MLCVLPVHSDYPEIQNLNRDDVLFVQLQRDIASYHRAAALKSKDSAPALTLFQYRLKRGDDLLAVAARLNLPYETITTLNGIESAEEFQSRDLIFIPNIPGIFVPLVPKNDLERIMFSWRETRKGETLSVSVQTHMDDQKLFFFFPGDRFHPVERAYFLRILFHFPLPGGRITSRFGMREHPFGGHPQFHNGIDLAAEIGTDVLAAREGTVAEVGYDRIYGKYILVDHKNGYQSLYGHLSSIDVSLNQWVNSGKIIGKVGNTGWSTGPHLHFEIRKKGKACDPVPLLPSRKMHGN
jgi:murein DD-endopeptidase MepM/ murein hydrolase activator NlpD